MSNECAHHWMIEPATPGGDGTSRGACGKCGAARQFHNSPDLGTPFDKSKGRRDHYGVGPVELARLRRADEDSMKALEPPLWMRGSRPTRGAQ